jgi:hypothetical protein
VLEGCVVAVSRMVLKDRTSTSGGSRALAGTVAPVTEKLGLVSDP